MMSFRGTSSNRRRKGPRGRPRRAIVAVVVLLLIAVALATSYAAMRSQTITLNVRQNASFGAAARQAALTGLSAGLRQMHSPAWSGTDTTFSRMLGANVSFQVAFIAGDDTLTAADPNYAELPYRVTLLVTGTASDPADSRRTSRHTIRAVARLIPRAVPNEPSDWSTMQNYTFYQTQQRITTLDIPARIEGRIRLQGRLDLGYDYPDDGDAWYSYFYHLYCMSVGNYGDYRPLTGRVDFDYSQQDWYVYNIVRDMQVARYNVTVDTANFDWSKPTSLTAYRLFPGGPQYSIPTLSGTLTNTTFGNSAADNPLGFYYANSNLVLGNNVTIRGTLFCQEEIRVNGANVVFESVNNPPLHGQSLPIRLPVAVCGSFNVRPGASCTVNGLLAAFGDVDVEPGASRGTLTINGRVITEDLDIRQDTDWDYLNWDAHYSLYYTTGLPNGVPFPVWMSMIGYHYLPTVLIKTGDDASYHWYRTGQTLFVPHTDDFSQMDATETPGLRWELIEIAYPSDSPN